MLAVAKLSGAKSLVSIWSGVSTRGFCLSSLFQISLSDSPHAHIILILSKGIVVLFLGRLATALLAIMDMNNCFSWRENAR